MLKEEGTAAERFRDNWITDCIYQTRRESYVLIGWPDYIPMSCGITSSSCACETAGISLSTMIKSNCEYSVVLNASLIAMIYSVPYTLTHSDIQ